VELGLNTKRFQRKWERSDVSYVTPCTYRIKSNCGMVVTSDVILKHLSVEREREREREGGKEE
jgi:hypothetical protein